MPDLLAGIFGIALMTAYWPGIEGAATTLRWDVAALLSIALLFEHRIRMTAPHWLGLALIGWLGLSVLWTDPDGQLDGAQGLIELGLAGIAFAVGSSMTTIRPLMVGAAVGISVNSAVAIAQWYGYHPVETVYGGYPGLFANRDRLAAAAALVGVGLVSLPRAWLALPLIGPALVMAPSRAAWLAVAAGLFVQAPWRTRIVVGACGAAAVAWLALHAGSEGQRFSIWRDTVVNLTFLGHGLGSFREDFLELAKSYDFAYWKSRPEHPHNEWLWLVFEGGAAGLALGCALAVSLWRRARDPSSRGILAALFVLSLFAMPFHDPATLILGAVVAGYAAAGRSRLVLGTVDRGLPICEGVATGGGGRRAF